MRALYLGQKPWKDRSAEFMSYARGKSGMDSRWNWRILPDARNEQLTGELGPVAWTSHINSGMAKIAYVYWLHYAYSLDEAWLRAQGYPVIRGAAEFYRNYPNVTKGADGKYHIHHVNNHESDWGTDDTPEELSAMHEMFPLAIRASEILGVDAEMRPLWQEMLDNLAPVPPALEPAEYYDLCAFGTDNRELHDRVLAEFNRQLAKGMSEMKKGATFSRVPIAACNLGLTEAIRHMLPALVQTREHSASLDYTGRGEWSIGVLRNRLGLDEGPGAIECERLGMASQVLHLSLLQSVPSAPGKEPINTLFPSWPREWDARFSLAARDAFVIGASLQNGKVAYVEIQSTKGGSCRVNNPWDQAELSLYRNGKEAGTVSGQLLVIATTAGDAVTLVPKGQPLPAH
jgi:hypothetical protein